MARLTNAMIKSGISDEKPLCTVQSLLSRLNPTPCIFKRQNDMRGETMQRGGIYYSWLERDPSRGFAAGVSLHSHTCMSKETLDFLAHLGSEFRLLRPIFANRERRCRDTHGLELNYKASYWTPPLPP